MTAGAVTVRTGDLLTIDGGNGVVVLGAAALQRPEPDGAVALLLEWMRELGVGLAAD